MTEEDRSAATPEPEEKPEAAEDPKGEALEEDTAEDGLVAEQLEEALREKDQFRTMAQRAQADLANYKKRVTEEMEELHRAANSRLLLRILSVVDDLERALVMVPEEAVAPGWLEGLQLVLRNINNLLDSEGVSKMEAVGLPFEPRDLEAVQFRETPDAEEGSVIEVVRDGYKHHDKVLRAAQVVVAKKPGPQNQPETAEEEAI